MCGKALQMNALRLKMAVPRRGVWHGEGETLHKGLWESGLGAKVGFWGELMGGEASHSNRPPLR